MLIRRILKAGLLLPMAIANATVLAQTAVADPPRRAQAAIGPISEGVVDPAASVPAVLYRSVFVDTPKGVETEEMDWKKANAEVGQFKRGHIDILQWEALQKGKP